MLRPLALHTEATGDILNPDRQLVAAWSERILEERQLIRVERDTQLRHARIRCLLVHREAIYISAWVFMHVLAKEAPETLAIAAIGWPDPRDAVERYRTMVGEESLTLIMQAECALALLGSAHVTPEAAGIELESLVRQAQTDQHVLAMDQAEIERFVQIAQTWKPVSYARDEELLCSSVEKAPLLSEGGFAP